MKFKWHWFTSIYWRLLKKSGIFRYWYKDYMGQLLSEVYFNMEIADIEQKEMVKKWAKRVRKVKRGRFIKPFVG